MSSVDELRIDLKAVAASGEHRCLALGSTYFEALEQDEISGGEVQIDLSVRATASDIFVVAYTIKGSVTTVCDRCLAPLEMSVDISDVLTLRYADDVEDAFDGDAKLISYADRYYDVAWDIYESINLSFPLVRVHNEGDCDKEMIAKIEALSGYRTDEN